MYTLKLKNFMAPFYGWGSTASRLEPLRGGSLLFTTKSHTQQSLQFLKLYFFFQISILTRLFLMSPPTNMMGAHGQHVLGFSSRKLNILVIKNEL